MLSDLRRETMQGRTDLRKRLVYGSGIHFYLVFPSACLEKRENQKSGKPVNQGKFAVIALLIVKLIPGGCEDTCGTSRMEESNDYL